MATLHVPTNQIYTPVRAIYYPTEDGMRLARVESFSKPVFAPSGWEDATPRPPKEGAKGASMAVENAEKGDAREPADAEANARRAIRRAKQNAFDLIMCNPDMNLFATLTYAPDQVEDKADYKECYRYFNSFVSNRVQRRGLKYVCAPERTKAGDIHFHMICTAAAFDMAVARNPYNSHIITRHGKPLYNLLDWKRGFSSAEYITDRKADGTAVERVAKYIFKYIGKDIGSKVGGRYLLTGGAFTHPVVQYGDAVGEFSTGKPTYTKRYDDDSIGVHYSCEYYI
jgi:hypothetical protein